EFTQHVLGHRSRNGVGDFPRFRFADATDPSVALDVPSSRGPLVLGVREPLLNQVGLSMQDLEQVGDDEISPNLPIGGTFEGLVHRSPLAANACRTSDVENTSERLLSLIHRSVPRASSSPATESTRPPHVACHLSRSEWTSSSGCTA